MNQGFCTRGLLAGVAAGLEGDVHGAAADIVA